MQDAASAAIPLCICTAHVLTAKTIRARSLFHLYGSMLQILFEGEYNSKVKSIRGNTVVSCLYCTLFTNYKTRPHYTSQLIDPYMRMTIVSYAKIYTMPTATLCVTLAKMSILQVCKSLEIWQLPVDITYIAYIAHYMYLLPIQTWYKLNKYDCMHEHG